MSTTAKKKPAAQEKFDVAEWLTDSDEFSHLDVEVFTSPRYKEWVSAKNDFDTLAEVLLSEDADADSGTLGEPSADHERLAQLHDKLAELTPIVEATRTTLRFVDATTKRDLNAIDAKYRDGDTYDGEGAFFEMLERFGLYEGEPKSLAEWELLARRVGVWQWSLIQSRCLEYLGREGEVSPDFSLPSLPVSRE